MIKERKPLALYEVIDTMGEIKETDKTKAIKSFIKKFSEIDSKEGSKLREELQKIDIIKLKETDIIKIVDLMPENAVELNKVVTESSLDSDETNKILETIKKFK